MVDCNSPTLVTEDMWKCIGFMRHADEFCLLAALIMERMSREGASNGALSSEGDDQEEAADPVLNKFDQNSMHQVVNQLIVNLENPHIT